MAQTTPPKPEAEDDVLQAVEAAEAADREKDRADSVTDAEKVPPVEMEEPRPDPTADVELAQVVPDPAPAAAPTMTPPPAPAKSGGGFVSTALGGVVAAAAGYALAVFVPFPGIGTSDAPPAVQPAEVQALADRIAALEGAPDPSAALQDRVAALESRPAPVAAEPDLTPVTDALAGLEARLTTLESQPPTIGGDAAPGDLVALVEGLRAEVAQLKASGDEATAGIEAMAAEAQTRLAEAEAQAATLKAEAEETARKALARAAIGRLQAALESGAPFASALADLPDAPIPPALAAAAESGVPSLAALEQAFPPAARAALDASRRADMGESWTERLGAFLQTTTGARSVTPRDGTDPDAVLSRAEAALRDGQLVTALQELQGLPAEGQAAMADWVGLAQQRLEAIDAVATLSSAVEG